MEHMELNEDKISFADIKQYLSLLKDDIEEMNSLEFKTIKGWLVYSLSLVVLLGVPCVIILLMTGLIPGSPTGGLLLAFSFIPIIFILPLTLLLTFIQNYKKPKKRRERVLKALRRIKWDTPIRQVGQLRLECEKDHFLFSTEIMPFKNPKGRYEDVAFMVVPFSLPDEGGEGCIEDMRVYLKNKSVFNVEPAGASVGISVLIFQHLDLSTDIDQLMYVMKRFSLRPRTCFKAQDITEKIPETMKIQALCAFDQDVDEQFIDWAKRMLDAGFGNETMRKLAAQTASSLPKTELKKIMKEIVREFNLELPPECALNNYLVYLIMVGQDDRMSVLEIMECLSNLYHSTQSPLLEELDLLYKAVKALYETGEQTVWTGTPPLTADNVDPYVFTYLFRKVSEFSGLWKKGK